MSGMERNNLQHYCRRPVIHVAILCGLLLAACGEQEPAAVDNSAELAALQQRLVALDTELRRVEDTRAIKNLQRAYGYYVDQALWDEVTDLFSEDATVELSLNGVYRGRERIREMLYHLGGGKAGLKPGQLNEHYQLQPVVHVAEDGMSAKGRWRAYIMAGEYGQSQSAVLGEGTYENEYRKVNGTWMISKLHWYQTFIVPYEGGWGANADVTGGDVLSPGITPDAPPTEEYPVWPGVYVPPFHYDNPVTGRK